jgi:hypothetical protein
VEQALIGPGLIDEAVNEPLPFDVLLRFAERASLFGRLWKLDDFIVAVTRARSHVCITSVCPARRLGRWPGCFHRRERTHGCAYARSISGSGSRPRLCRWTLGAGPKGAGLWSLDTVVRGNLHARSDRNLMRPRVSRQRLRAVRCEDLRSRRPVVYWTATPLEVAQSLGIGNT